MNLSHLHIIKIVLVEKHRWTIKHCFDIGLRLDFKQIAHFLDRNSTKMLDLLFFFFIHLKKEKKNIRKIFVRKNDEYYGFKIYFLSALEAASPADVTPEFIASPVASAVDCMRFICLKCSFIVFLLLL